MVLGTIEEAGVGGTALAIYTYITLEIAPLEFGYRPQLLYSIIPVIVLILVIDSFNDPIMEFVAGEDFLRRVHEEVRDEVGDEEFYYDHENKQEKIDELDKKAVGRVVNIIVGTFISLTLPLLGYPTAGLWGVISGAITGVIIFYILVFKQRSKLRNIISELSRLY